MEVKEVHKLVDPATGRMLHVHLGDDEVREIMQAGFVFLLQLGHLNYRSLLQEPSAPELVVPEGETKQ